MSTEITTYEGATLDAQMRYAEVISTGAMLPTAYRGKPADILIATGLGNAIGIAPAQALYEIYVVNGRPSPSANLMAALVRRAGHKLRIEGDHTRCTATLIRADDPDYPFTATWTIEQAKAAGLAGKDTWKQYPGAMLRARAVAEVVRMGAPEAVMGMEYAREEMADVEAPTPPKPTGMDAVRMAAQPTQAPEEPVDADVVDDPLTTRTQRRMHALFNELGIDEDEQRAGIAHVVGRPIESRKDVTESEARQVIQRLEVKKAEREAGADPVEPGLFPEGGAA